MIPQKTQRAVAGSPLEKALEQAGGGENNEGKALSDKFGVRTYENICFIYYWKEELYKRSYISASEGNLVLGMQK